jgi:hypothetical protein
MECNYLNIIKFLIFELLFYIIKVLELIFKSFEKEKTLYLNFENTIKFREDLNFSESLNNDQFKIIIGMDSATSLLVILREQKKVFCIEGNERNAMKEKFYLKKCK